MDTKAAIWVVQKTVVDEEMGRIHERWKLPTPSCMATFNFSLITNFELYSGSLR
jgi:hypothetical protein